MKEFIFYPENYSCLYDKQKVYFTCHPDDYDLFYEFVSGILLKHFDCVVCSFRDVVDDIQEYSLRLSEMKAFIVPITQKMLLEKNRARDFDIKYALDHNIPVLPLIETPGLAEFFSTRFGNLQCIDKSACNITTFSYEEKIVRFLSSFLVNKEIIRQIQATFYARIFLSYRKKDREFANQLMRIIHDIPFCRDVAIWFDEYLVPGEDFNEAIEQAMKRSRLFALCVTENLVNEQNYISKTEYPKARELAMPVLPVLSRPMSNDHLVTLKEMYESIPDCLDGRSDEELTEALQSILAELAESPLNDDPVHLFFVGLAYLNGIEVEVNHARAADLIEASADRDYEPAVKKLANMYRFGEGVKRDPEKAAELLKKDVRLISSSGGKAELYDSLYSLLEFFLHADLPLQLENAEYIHDCTMRILSIATDISLCDEEMLKLFSLLAFVNLFDEKVADGFIHAALRLLETSCETDYRMRAETALFYNRLALYYYQHSAGRIVYLCKENAARELKKEKAETYARKSIELLSALHNENPYQWREYYADALTRFCMMFFIEPLCNDETIVGYAEQAIAFYRQLNAERNDFYADRIAGLCRDFGNYLAYDLDVVWEDLFHFQLDLDVDYVPTDAPECKIPLSVKLFDGFDNKYDVRRVKKALALMRYGVQWYLKAIDNGQSFLIVDLAQAYSQLAKLQYCLSEWISSNEKSEMEDIEIGLLKDAFHCYRDMLRCLCRGYNLLRQKNLNEHERSRTDFVASKDSEEALLEMEDRAYNSDYFSSGECYNFAVHLRACGLKSEAAQLHEELYHFFKNGPKSADPVLVLMNLYEYVRDKTDIDEIISILLEYDDNETENNKQKTYVSLYFVDIFFNYYCKLAKCLLEKERFSEADAFCHKAKQEYVGKMRKNPEENVRLVYLWARCKKGAGDLTGAETLILEGLDILMSMEPTPPKLWNRLCREYASLLTYMGKPMEAEDWLNETLPE